MYEVIRTKIRDKGKLVRPYVSMGRFKTREDAQQAILTKPSKRDLETYEFTVVPAQTIESWTG